MYVETSNNPQYKLVASLPKKNIKLFALSSQYAGNYDNFLLSVNGKIAVFKWRSETSITFSPKLILSDINNDKVEELSIILTTGSGSDIHMEDIHIINMNTLNEYTVTNPLIIIKEKVTTQITKKDRDVLIQVKLNSNQYNIKKDTTYAGTWFENVYFGNSIHWKVTDNKLYAYIDAQVSPSGYVGTVKIQYKFENNIFNLDNISFELST